MGDRKDKLSAGRHGTKFWEEEKSNFGLKMMGKMGWEQGQGLGKDKQGSTQFVRAKIKNDNQGIGATRVNGDDMFSASTGLYNELLKRLNANKMEVGEGGADLTEQDEGDKSTQSQLQTYVARQNLYGKFRATKEKWKSSSQSLSEILGTPAASAKAAASLAARSGAGEQAAAAAADNDKNGLVTVTATTSLRDYFNKKLAEKGKAVTKFQSASGNGFTQDFQTQYYERMMTASVKGHVGLGFGGAGNGANESSSSSSGGNSHSGAANAYTAAVMAKAANALAPAVAVAAADADGDATPSKSERKAARKEAKAAAALAAAIATAIEEAVVAKAERKAAKKSQKAGAAAATDKAAAAEKEKRGGKSEKKVKKHLQPEHPVRQSPRLHSSSDPSAAAPLPSLSLDAGGGGGGDGEKKSKKSKKEKAKKQ
jgi:hypothetical protein